MSDLKIVDATGIPDIYNGVDSLDGFKVVDRVDARSYIMETCYKNNPDILLLSSDLYGKESLPEIVQGLRLDGQKIRVVLITGEYDPLRQDIVAFFSSMAFAKVYDILHGDNITLAMIEEILRNPRSKSDVEQFIKRHKEKSNKFRFKVEKEEDVFDNSYPNIFSISSIKPGTGKSFVSTNVATMIAKFGKKTPEGKAPTVGLIEADLQNLSLGTILQIEDDKYNLKSAMDRIYNTVDKDCRFIVDESEVEETNKFIESCFQPYRNDMRTKNLYAMVGSQLTLQQLEKITAVHYSYLLERAADMFDVVIVDTNSSLTQVNTFPLLKLSNKCFYVMNLDYNNVRNNTRYKNFLRDLEIDKKVEYILNEDITSEIEKKEGEPLEYTAKDVENGHIKFDFIAKVPMISKTTFLNAIYEGVPIGISKKPNTLHARFELAKIADEIWPLENYEDLKEEYEKSKGPKKQGLFSKLFSH